MHAPPTSACAPGTTHMPSPSRPRAAQVRTDLCAADAPPFYACFRHLAAHPDVRLRVSCASVLHGLMSLQLPGAGPEYFSDTLADLAADGDESVRVALAGGLGQVRTHGGACWVAHWAGVRAVNCAEAEPLLQLALPAASAKQLSGTATRAACSAAAGGDRAGAACCWRSPAQAAACAAARQPCSVRCAAAWAGPLPGRHGWHGGAAQVRRGAAAQWICHGAHAPNWRV